MSDFSIMVPPEESDNNGARTQQRLERLFRNVYISLGGSEIRVELLDEDYDFAWRRAVSTYRELSGNSVYKTFGFLKIERFKQIYTVHEMIDNVIMIYRTRGFFATGTSFDPFSTATANLLLRNARPESGFMGVATFDFYLQYEETLGRIFAREIHFLFRPETHTIVLYQLPKSDEQIVLECMVLKSWDELLADHFAQLWLEKYTAAVVKSILARKYSKFQTLPSAQGGMALGGTELGSQAMEEMKTLEAEILNFWDSATIPLPIMG